MTSTHPVLGSLELVARPRRNGYGGLLLQAAANNIMPVLAETNSRERSILLKQYQRQLKKAISEVLSTTPARGIMLKAGLSRRQLELEIVLRLVMPFVHSSETANIGNLITVGVPMVFPEILRECAVPGMCSVDFSTVLLARNLRHAHNFRSFVHLAEVIAAIYRWKPAIESYIEERYQADHNMLGKMFCELYQDHFTAAVQRVARRLELMFEATEYLDESQLRYLASGHEAGEALSAAAVVEDLQGYLEERRQAHSPSQN